MNDKFSDEMLSAYLDGELSPAERAEVEALLESSPAAQAQLADFQKLSSWMHELPAARPPQGFADQVLRQAERSALLRQPEPAPIAVSSTRRTWLKPTLGIAAAAAVVVFLVRTVPEPEADHQRAARVEAKSEAADVKAMAVEAEPQIAPPTSVATESLMVRDELQRENLVAAPLAKDAPEDEPAGAPELEEKIAKLPADDQPWDRRRIGEVIDVPVVDASEEQVAVYKAVVVNIDKWVGGTQIDVIRLGDKSQTIALHLEASPHELADLVAKLNEDSGQLLDLKRGEPILVAQLPPTQRDLFVNHSKKGQAKTDGELNVDSTFGSRAEPESHTARQVPHPVPPAERQKEQATVEADKAETETSDSDAEAAPTDVQEVKIAGVDPAKSQLLYVSAAPDFLQRQFQVDVPALKPTAPAATGRHARARTLGKSDAAPRVRMILLVRQQPPESAAEKPPTEKAGDGGGAA